MASEEYIVRCRCYLTWRRRPTHRESVHALYDVSELRGGREEDVLCSGQIFYPAVQLHDLHLRTRMLRWIGRRVTVISWDWFLQSYMVGWHLLYLWGPFWHSTHINGLIIMLQIMQNVKYKRIFKPLNAERSNWSFHVNQPLAFRLRNSSSKTKWTLNSGVVPLGFFVSPFYHVQIPRQLSVAL